MGHPFFQSYGVILPSSLTRVIPIALVFSTRLPVSVCGTGTCNLARGFSRRHRLNRLALGVPQADHRPSVSGSGFTYLRQRPTGLDVASGARPTFPRPPIASLSITGGTGISTRCPSPTPHGLGLGPTNPGRINLAREPLGLRRGGFSPPLRYSFRHSHFCTLHVSSQSRFAACRTLPYRSRSRDRNLTASVLGLSPVTLSAQDRLTSELLRTL
jgi:hypothetical protein